MMWLDEQNHKNELDSLRSEVDGIVDSIEEYLERSADGLPSVIREFSFAADVNDDMEFVIVWWFASLQANSSQKFVELLSKSA